MEYLCKGAERKAPVPEKETAGRWGGGGRGQVKGRRMERRRRPLSPEERVALSPEEREVVWRDGDKKRQGEDEEEGLAQVKGGVPEEVERWRRRRQGEEEGKASLA